MEQKFLKISSKNMRYNWMRRILHADQRQKQNHKEENLLAFHQESFPLEEGIGLTLHQGNILSPILKFRRKCHLLRHSQQVHREEDGAVHFRRVKENLCNPFPHSVHWSDDRWKACLAAGAGAQKKFQYCTDDSGTIVCFRALQGHSGRNLIYPSLQDNVVIPSNSSNIYHIGCAFNLHSIINNGLILGGQNSSKRQTVFFLPFEPRDKEHKDPEEIDLNVPRHAQYLHNAWKRHIKTQYIGFDINLAIQNGLTFYHTRSNVIILQETLPAYCIPKVVRMKTGEVLYEKEYMSPRPPPPKISLKHEWEKRIGFGSCSTTRTRSCSTSKKFPTNPTNSKSN